MTILSAQLYDGVTAEVHHVTIELSVEALLVQRGERTQCYALKALSVSPQAGRAKRFIYLPDGAQLSCEDCDGLARMPQRAAAEGLVAWLDQRWWVALIAMVVSALLIGRGLFVWLPRSSEQLANHVSIAREASMRAEVLEGIEGTQLFAKTRLSDPEIERARTLFAQLKAGLAFESFARLELRSAPAIGANAFALLGGTILVTDGMVSLCESDAQLASVLAHELGHLERRHLLREIVQSSGLSVVAGVLLGDVSSVVVLASIPTTLLNRKFSRAMETDADEFALRLLASHGIPAAAFADALERISNQPALQRTETFSYLSSHPEAQLRIQRIREFGRAVQIDRERPM